MGNLHGAYIPMLDAFESRLPTLGRKDFPNNVLQRLYNSTLR
jgi:hypothetical protein